MKRAKPWKIIISGMLVLASIISCMPIPAFGIDFDSTLDNKIKNGETIFSNGATLAHVGCGQQNSTPQSDAQPTTQSDTEPTQQSEYSADAATVKALLEGIDPNAALTNEKSYVTSFRQKYRVASKTDSDLEKDDYALSYEGEGTVTLVVKLKGGQTEDKEVFNAEVIGADLLKNGTGYLIGYQEEKYDYKDEYIDKTDEEKSGTVEMNTEDHHDFAIAIDEDYFYASGLREYHDLNDPEEDINDAFHGKIPKAAIVNAATDKVVQDTGTQLLFMDAWPFIRQISQHSNQLFSDMDFSDVDAVNAHFEKHKVHAKEAEDDTVEVTFVLDAHALLEEMLEDKTDASAKISGSMTIKKGTGEVTAYTYDLAEVLDALLQADKEGKVECDAQVENFTVSGQIRNSQLKGVKVENEFVEYSEEDVAAFMEQMMEHVVPS